jgi:hypothetical protein
MPHLRAASLIEVAIEDAASGIGIGERIGLVAVLVEDDFIEGG